MSSILGLITARGIFYDILYFSSQYCLLESVSLRSSRRFATPIRRGWHPTHAQVMRFVCQAAGQHFQRLEALLLAGNGISTWASIDALNHFPHLREARLTGNPIFAAEHSSARAEVRML